MKDNYSFNDLLQIIKKLRSDEGCPWDREQNHQTLKKNLIEESYEAIEAIDKGNYKEIAEELGDVLLQIVFHSQIGFENQTFDINDVINSICKKMITRHPHVFSDVIAKTADEVLGNWENIKKKEKNIIKNSEAMKSVSNYLPALIRSYKIQEKAIKANFDLKDANYALNKAYEEILELKEQVEKGEKSKNSDKIGSILFLIVSASRHLGVCPELSLKKTTENFIKEFEYAESGKTLQGKGFDG